jgi:hypothetical protein
MGYPELITWSTPLPVVVGVSDNGAPICKSFAFNTGSVTEEVLCKPGIVKDFIFAQV